jgi:endonuclease/exonuclease/phosphatase family metal-dependent hydrolase
VLADYLPTLLDALATQGAAYDVHAADVSFDGGLPVGDRWMQVTGSNVLLVRRGAGLEVVGEGTGRFATTAELELAVGGLTFPVRRGWGSVDIERDGVRVRVLNTHTEAWDTTVRDAQRDELLAVAGGTGLAVLLGDLNASPAEVGVPAPWVDVWLAAGGDPAGGLTCGQSGDLSNADADLRERIDYVFTRGLTVRTCRVVGGQPQDRTPTGLWPSDHAAVVAELTA